MDSLNPLATSLLQSTFVQRRQAIEKQRQVRREQTAQKNIAARDDEMEHQVESVEEDSVIHDEATKHEQQSKKKPPHHSPSAGEEETGTHLDLTA